MPMVNPKVKTQTILIEMPPKLISSLRYLSTIKDSSGKKHSISEIVVGACNLYLMGIQSVADAKMEQEKKDKKKMN